MANLIQSALQKIRDTATSLGKTVQSDVGNIGQGINNAASWTNTNVVKPLVQSGAIGVGNFQSPINIPQNTVFGKNVGSPDGVAAGFNQGGVWGNLSQDPTVYEASKHPITDLPGLGKFAGNTINQGLEGLMGSMGAMPQIAPQELMKFSPKTLATNIAAAPVIQGAVGLLKGEPVSVKDLATTTVANAPFALMMGSMAERPGYNDILLNEKSIKDFYNKAKTVEDMRLPAFQDTLAQAEKLGGLHAKDILATPEMQALKASKPVEWIKTVANFLQDRTVQATEGTKAMGLSTREMKGAMPTKDAQAGLYDQPQIKMNRSTGKIYLKVGDNQVITDVPKTVQNDIYNASEGVIPRPDRRTAVNTYLNRKGFEMGADGTITRVAQQPIGDAKILQGALDKGSNNFIGNLESSKPGQKFTPQEQKLLSEFNDYVMKPEVYAKYEAGAKDPQIIQEFLAQRGQQPLSVPKGVGEVKVGQNPSEVPSIQSPKIQTQVTAPTDIAKTVSHDILPPVDQNTSSPNILTQQGKQRSFLDTVVTSDQTAPKLKTQVKSDLSQTYQVKANKALTDTAQAAVKSNSDTVLADVLSNTPANDQKVANAIELSKKYQSQGNYDQAVQVIDHMDQQLRDAGRTVQAASLWNNLTPDGMVRAAEKAAEDVGKVIAPDVKSGILAKMKDIQGLPEAQKTLKTTELMNYIADNIPASPWEKFKTAFDAYRYTNMLSGPQTHERNIYQNVFNTLITRPADMGAQAVYDLAKHPFNPLARDVHFSDIPAYYKNLSVTVPESISAASRAFSETMSPKFEDTSGGKSAILNLRRDKMIPGVLKVIPGMLEAQDKFFSSLISQGEYARLTKNGVADTQAQAGAKALADEYLVRTRLGKTTAKDSLFVRALDGIGQGMENMRKLPVVGEAAKWFIPFVQTPINVAKMMVQHSPLGLAGGEYSTKQLAAATTGAVALGTGALFASQGKTTWAAPTDPTQKDLFYASGRQPYSIQVGDKWVPMWYFGPYALSLAIPAAVQNIYQDSKTAQTASDLSKIGSVISGTMGFLMSQTPMQGTAGLFRLMNGDVSTTIPGMLAGTVTQAIPAESFVRWVNNTFIDPVYRKGSDFVSTIEKGLPIASKTLDPYTLPMSNTPSTRDTVNSFLPYNITGQQNAYESLFNQRTTKLQQNSIDTQALNAVKDTQGGGQSVGNGRYAYWDSSSATSKILDTSKVTNMTSSTNYDKALKEKAAFALVDNITNSSLDSATKQQALNDLGISQEDASYYNIAKQTTDIKNVYIQDEISRISAGSNNRADILNYLVSQRKDVNGSMVLANGVVDQLYQDQIITKDEATKLKAVSVKNGVTKTKLSGRGSKVTFKKIQAPPASPKIKAKAYTMGELLAKSGKTKIRTKRYNFTKKI